MTVLSGQSIRDALIFDPFNYRTVHESGLTYGVGAASYDVCIDQDVSLMRGKHKVHLASIQEHITMPTGIVGIVHDKSSWAREGLFVQNTLIDPGWFGYLTLELTYHGDNFPLIKKGTPIAQICFHKLDKETEYPYKGKYQNQQRGPQESIR